MEPIITILMRNFRRGVKNGELQFLPEGEEKPVQGADKQQIMNMLKENVLEDYEQT